MSQAAAEASNGDALFDALREHHAALLRAILRRSLQPWGGGGAELLGEFVRSSEDEAAAAANTGRGA